MTQAKYIGVVFIENKLKQYFKVIFTVHISDEQTTIITQAL